MHSWILKPVRLCLAVAVSGALSTCARSPEAVHAREDRPKYEPKKDPAADEALRRASQIAEGSSKQKAAEAYLSVAKAYAETTAAQEALYRAGVLAFESGDYANARKAFNQLLFENPLFDKAQDAKLKLGLAALQVRAYRDAYQTLSSVAPRLSGEEAKTAIAAAGRAAEGAQLYGESLRIALRSVDEAKTAEEQAAAVERLTNLVEGKAGFIDIAEAAQNVRTSSPAWPILTFKLARIYYHLRDWTHLEETLQRFLREAPNHPFAQQAQDLLSRSHRRSEARPRSFLYSDRTGTATEPATG